MPKEIHDAAHGGKGWLPRKTSLLKEIGNVWGTCGVATEWSGLEAVLMHRPGPEIESISDANKTLMSAIPEPILTRHQHDNLAKKYRNFGANVFYIEPRDTPPPNLMFVADLFFMTPEGAILARPASIVRAGEERFVARKLAELGIPILRCVRGEGVFEGADASWIDSRTVILATGLRTNSDGANQVTSILKEMGVDVVSVRLPKEAMHLMGTFRLVDEDLAICWKEHTPKTAVKALKDFGKDVVFISGGKEVRLGMALNFVVLEPKRIIMPAGNPNTESFLKNLGIKCLTVEVNELHKASGGIGCLSGILKRDQSGAG